MYVGRLAPTPSGHLHVGHAQTFWIAQLRAKQFENGKLILRIEDLDEQRCKREFLTEMIEDLTWFGIQWDVGPPLPAKETLIDEWGKTCVQSKRVDLYEEAWRVLYEGGYIYPSAHSRKDVQASISAPHEGDEEVIFPTSLRPDYMATSDACEGRARGTDCFPADMQGLRHPSQRRSIIKKDMSRKLYK